MRNEDSFSPSPLVRTKDRAAADTFSLVLSSTGISHQVTSDNGEFSLYVADTDLLKAQWQLRNYQQENMNWPPVRSRPDQPELDFRLLPFLLCMLLIGVYYFSGPWTFRSEWFAAGAGNTTAMLVQGQWYRTVTALFLHADFVHLLGNIFTGSIVFYFLCLSAGNGMALFLTIVPAALANMINTLMRGIDYNYVGFSTAVFTIIGTLATMQTKQEKTISTVSGITVPVLAGFGLLAILGSSGERTDLMGHFFGLAAGFVSGFIFRSRISRMRKRMWLQFVLGFSAAATIFLSWFLAFYIHSAG